MKRLLTIAVAIGTLGSERAEACTSVASTGLDGFSVFPSMGSMAPRNTAIWIPVRPSDNVMPLITPGDIVVNQGDVTLAADVRARPVAGESESTLYLITPTEPFVAGASIEVRIRDAVVTQFTILADEDRIAPLAPVVDHVVVTSGYFGAFSCVESSEIAVTVRDNQDLLLLTAVGSPDELVGISATPEVRVLDQESGDYALQILSVDTAGNESARVALPLLTVPNETSGCRASGGSGGATVFFVLAALARRRSRRS